MTVVCLSDAEARAMVGELPAGVEVVLWDGHGAPPAGAERVELLVARYNSEPWSAEALAALSSLQVIQLLSAGVETWAGRVPTGVTLCNGRGIHGASTAELALAGMLALLRELPRFLDGQRRHDQPRESTESLDGKRVLVLGAGDIGRRIAAAVKIFGADATLVARHQRDGVHAISELPQLLPVHEVVAIAIPKTPETVGLVDAEFLAAMPDGGLLVNIARGTIVDTDALLAELTAGRLSAFLDVTEPEPLPPDHPLWDAPNLLLTPHVGGGTHGWERRAYQIAGDQIRRLQAGEPLENVVSEGY